MNQTSPLPEQVPELGGDPRGSAPELQSPGKPGSGRLRAGRRLPASVLLAGWVSAAAGLAAFTPALRNQFVYDDLPIIVENATVTQPGHWYRFWREPWWPRGTSNDRLYRPLTLWSFRANLVLAPGTTFQTVGDGQDARATPDPFWFHLVNLVLHGLTCTGVALLTYRISGRATAAWIAGLLFAAHPIHTESVVTGYGRAELLAGLFSVWLLARYCSPWYRTQSENRKSLLPVSPVQDSSQTPASCRTPHDTAGRQGAAFHVINALLLLAALMSKEHAVFVWPVLMLIDLWRRRTQSPPLPWRDWLNRTVGPPHALYALATATFFLLRFSVFAWKARIPGSDLPYWQSPLGHAGLVEHLLTPFRLGWLSLELLVWPPRLCPIWSVPALPLADRLSADVIGGMLVIALLLVLGVILWWRRALSGAMVIGLLVLLALPVQAVPIANWLFAERWLYLPTLLVAPLVGLALARLSLSGVLLSVAFALLLLPASWSYTSAFHDNLALLRDVVRRQPDNLQGQKNLTGAMLVIGDPAAAVQIGREAIRRFGDIPEVYIYLTRAHLLLGDGEAALAALDQYMRSTAGKPGLAYGHLRGEAEVLIRKKLARASAPSTRGQREDAAPD